MTATRVKDLNVLAIYVTDMERSRVFYSKHLGFEMAGDMPPGVEIRWRRVHLCPPLHGRLKRPAAITGDRSPG